MDINKCKGRIDSTYNNIQSEIDSLNGIKSSSYAVWESETQTVFCDIIDYVTSQLSDIANQSLYLKNKLIEEDEE